MHHPTLRRGFAAIAAAAAFTLFQPVASRAADVQWDVSLPWGPTEFHSTNAQTFAEEVKAVTGGAVEMTIYTGGALGIKRSRRGREPRFEIARLLPRAVGAVLHVSDVNPRDYKIDEHGVVRNTAADGAAYTMGHQWNRAPYPVQNGIRRAWSGDRVRVPL